ncbi:hypothetical protein OH491_24295 [Termitidicoccus mucosus]|uniref:Uncharacterized protein n=1 Tax=Termitidicoccus mucosus TaxID=1184151 RepID=A0A178IPB0_9BACT|nr:hypothetical protein AW736_02150 [Opitutaceae bacterium TSB47]
MKIQHLHRKQRHIAIELYAKNHDAYASMAEPHIGSIAEILKFIRHWMQRGYAFVSYGIPGRRALESPGEAERSATTGICAHYRRICGEHPPNQTRATQTRSNQRQLPKPPIGLT